MCSAGGGTIEIRPAPPDTEIPNSSFLIPNFSRISYLRNSLCIAQFASTCPRTGTCCSRSTR